MRQERGAKTSECFLNPSPGKHCWTVFFFPCSYQTVSLIYSHPNKHSAAAASCAFRVGTSGKKGPGISPGYLGSFEGASPPSLPPTPEWCVSHEMTDKNPDTRPPLQRPDDALTEPSCSGAPGATAIEWKGGGRISETARIERWWLFFTVVTGARVYLLHVCGNKYVIPSSCHPNPTMGANSVDILS